MVSILKVLYHILSKKRFALFMMFSVLVIAAGYAASKIKLEEDITRAIPFGDDGEEYSRILKEFKFLDRIVFRVFSSEENRLDDFRELAVFADEFVKELKSSSASSLIAAYSTDRMSFDTFKIHDHFYNNLPLFLEESDYQYLEKSMEHEELSGILDSLYKNMVTPSGMISAKYIRKDPFSLTFRSMEKLKSVNPETNFEIIDGHIYTLDRKNLIFFIEPAIEGSETGRNSELVRIMDTLLKDLSEKTGSKIKGEYFGGLPIAVGSADMIKRDVINSSIVAVLLVFFILLFYFRKIRFIPLIFIPAFFGGLLAVAFTALFKGTVSAISLGITSVLLGITVDYAIHTVSHILKRKDTGEAISELSFPMILSCLTTVAAFACLLFLDSSALNDLGLLALISVLSAMLFSVIVLPHVVDLMKGVRKETDFEKENSIISRISAFEFEKRKGAVITVLMLTLGFYFFSKNTAFEDDLNNINYMKPETVEAMNNLDRISSINKKSVYLVFSGKTFDEVLEKRERGEKLISGLLEKGLADSVTDISKLVLSKREQLEKIEKWNRFFTPERKEKLRSSLIEEGAELGFKEETFSPFFELLNSDFKTVEPVELTKFAPSLFDEWIAESENGYMTASLLKLSAPDSSEISKIVSENSEMFLFDRAEIMHRFVKYLKIDFEKLLNYSILIVFLILFILSGRIELALLSMIPVIFSWIWTLGIMNIFDIKFNIVNIIIVTFIFGLGIDYVAFIMRAKMQEYTHGSKEAAVSYKSSILISCLTTIAGVGALFGAVHPALRSIAVIAVTGMISTLINSFVIAPFLFDWLMLRQKKKKTPPHTFVVFTYTFLAYANYVIFSLILSSIGFAIFTTWPFKSGRNIRKYLYHLMIKSLARLVILSAPQVRLRKNNPHNEDFKKPAVIISNHSSFLDILMMLSLQVKIVMVTKKWVSSNPIFGKLVQFADFFTTTEGFEKMGPELQKCIDAGYSVVVFPEGTRGDGINLQRFHKGAFFLADQLKLDIVPIVIHGAGHSIKKGEFSVRGSTLSYNILKRISAGSTEYGETYQEKCKNISAMFKREYESVYEKLGTVDFYRDRLINNYVYKGPDIEWYVRIKVRLEDNYRFFNNIIPRKAEIYDIGCGMGMLTFMLTLTSKERSVKAIDYDETKISIAKNCYSCNERTTFVCDDATKVSFERADVFIMNDVLHYLPVEKQSELIIRCAEKLNKNGIIIIRDADTGMSEKHGNTVVTEKFSTGLKFNQADTGLNFVSRAVIEKAAVSAGLSFEVVKHQKKTSNVVYLLKKQGVADV